MEGQTLSDSTPRRSLEESELQRQEGDGGAGAGGGEGESSFMGTEFQFGKVRKFWRWMVVQQCECHSIMHLKMAI